MNRAKLIALLILIVIFQPISAFTSDLSFENYKSDTKPSRVAKMLDLSNSFARKFKTILSTELAKGPNFSGQYRIPQIGCGSGCAEIAIINCETGQVFDPKLIIDGAYDWVKSDKIEFRNDSSLLILRGCLNEKTDKCGTHYLQWTGKSLRKIQFIPGLKLEGDTIVEGPLVSKLIGLKDVRATIALLRTPDGHGAIELDKFHTPEAVRFGPVNTPVNAPGLRRIMFAVKGIDAVIAHMRARGAELIGEMQYENTYRLAYIRGPEGLIVGFAEEL